MTVAIFPIEATYSTMQGIHFQINLGKGFRDLS